MTTMSNGDRARAAAIGWAAIYAVGHRFAAMPLGVLIRLAQSTYMAIRPGGYKSITVDGVWGPDTAMACTILLRQCTNDANLLTSSGFIAAFLSGTSNQTALIGYPIRTSALVQSNYTKIDSAVQSLSDRTEILECVGFVALGEGTALAAQGGRNASETEANAKGYISAQTASPTPQAQGGADATTVATTVNSTRNVPATLTQNLSAAGQVPTAMPAVIPAAVTNPADNVSSPTPPAKLPATPQYESLRIAAPLYKDPKVLIPAGLGLAFVLVFVVKKFRAPKRGRR